MANISIFGGSNTRPGEAVYQDAIWLGAALANSGHVVQTGGYIGVMEAISRRAAEAGGHVIGVTCGDIESWRPVKLNPWVLEERKAGTLIERLDILINSCDAALVMPGGPGTLTEIALTWNLLLTHSIKPRPLILIGQGWQVTFTAFMDAFDGFIPQDQRNWLTFAADVQSALVELDLALKRLN
jgi:uncharacterized protein (TIGR00725 family)